VRRATRVAIAPTGLVADEQVADWPAFDVRGVIEGFYNNPFSVNQRRTTLRLMRVLRQNTYFYAPKDDPESSTSWATPYPAERGAEIRDAVMEAEANGVELVWGAAPVLAVAYKKPEQSIRFSSDEDFARLVAKIDSVRSLGVRRFALLFDDVPAPLYHEADRAAFPTAAAAHAALANRLVATLGDGIYFVGRFYTRFDGWEAYNDELGRLLDPRVDVLWTGPTTFSPEIPTSDIREINDRIKRPVIIWDNWPTKPEPFTGRDPALHTVAAGFLSNATMVGDFGLPIDSFWRVLGPIAEYTWRPAAYSAEGAFAAWGEALPAALDCAR
jgi:hyaluronoglucosaminidase